MKRQSFCLLIDMRTITLPLMTYLSDREFTTVSTPSIVSLKVIRMRFNVGFKAMKTIFKKIIQ